MKLVMGGNGLGQPFWIFPVLIALGWLLSLKSEMSMTADVQSSH